MKSQLIIYPETDSGKFQKWPSCFHCYRIFKPSCLRGKCKNFVRREPARQSVEKRVGSRISLAANTLFSTAADRHANHRGRIICLFHLARIPFLCVGLDRPGNAPRIGSQGLEKQRNCFSSTVFRSLCHGMEYARNRLRKQLRLRAEVCGSADSIRS